jgi:hypothetical protein
MGSEVRLTGRLVAAGRTLAGIGAEDFARAAGITTERLGSMEANGSAPLETDSDAEAAGRALDQFGIVVVGEGGGMGAGVRLKFTRQDVKQIGRLEGEGGIVGSDDAP